MDPHRLGLVSTRLHYFHLVARLGSIRRAAEALNVAPSSISRVIAQLEQDLGTLLFERVRQRLKLTSAGELLVYHARASLAELTRATNEMGDLQGLRRGTVTIAVVESVARGLLPDALARFWQHHPGVTVVSRVMASQAAFDAVADGECDIAVAFDVRAPRNAQRLAGATLAVGALVPPGHRLAPETVIRLADLAGERLVLSDSSLTLGLTLDEALAAASIEPPRRAVTNSIGLMADLAADGLGIAVQTRVGVDREIRSGVLVFVPLRDPRLKPRKLLLIARAKAHISEAATSLATLLARAVETYSEA